VIEFSMCSSEGTTGTEGFVVLLLWGDIGLEKVFTGVDKEKTTKIDISLGIT